MRPASAGRENHPQPPTSAGRSPSFRLKGFSGIGPRLGLPPRLLGGGSGQRFPIRPSDNRINKFGELLLVGVMNTSRESLGMETCRNWNSARVV